MSICSLAGTATPTPGVAESIDLLSLESKFRSEADHGRNPMVRARAAHAVAAIKLALAFVRGSYPLLERVRKGDTLQLAPTESKLINELLGEIHDTYYWINNEISTKYAGSSSF